MTGRELVDWGPVRCLDHETGAVVFEGVAIAAGTPGVLVRDDTGRQRWWSTDHVRAAN